MIGIPAFLDSDFELLIGVPGTISGRRAKAPVDSEGNKITADLYKRDCYIQSVQLGPAGLQTRVDESMYGIPHHEFKYPNFIINFVVRNIGILDVGVKKLSFFHKAFSDQFDSETGVPTFRYLTGLDIAIHLLSQKYAGLTSMNAFIFKHCKFGQPILSQLQSQGSGFIQYQVQVSFTDFEISNDLEFKHVNAEIASQAIFRTLEALAIAKDKDLSNYEGSTFV